MKKIILIFLILFSCSSVFAKPGGYRQIIEESSRLNFNVVSSIEGDSDKLIVFIEDAHCNYIAQKEVALIIDRLIATENFQIITVEGSEGEILTHLFSTFPVDEIRQKYSDKLLQNGFISGEEYFAISQGNPVRIYGVDDREVYTQNIEVFKDFFSLYNDSYAVLDKLKYGFFSVKEANYNESLFEFEKKCMAFKKKTINLEQLIEYCSANIAGYEVLVKKFEEIQKLNNIINKQKDFDYKLLDKQTRGLTSYINKNCSPEISEKCKSLVFQHLTGKIESNVFYEKLLDAAKQNIPDNPAVYSYLTKYIEITNVASSINYKKLNLELAGFIELCYSTFLKTSIEKKIFNLSNEFEIYENIFNLTLTRIEYQKWFNSIQQEDRFRKFLEDYNNLSKNEHVTDEEGYLLEKLFNNNFDFYNLAVQRDKFIFKNTCELINNEKINNVILIAGGFHSEKIFEDCRSNDISCIVIRPNNVGESDFKQYARVLLREDLFSGDPQITNYPDKLRATSFFAEYSFDDTTRINEFRNEFIFNAVVESLETFSYSEIFEIVKAWRNGFEKAVNIRYPHNGQKAKQALDMFDYIVTDVFSFGNIDINPHAQSITVSGAGQTVKITKQPGSEILVEPVYTVSKLEQNMTLKTEPVVLENSQIFISSWTIADEESEFLGHGDAHYSVKYIQAMNLRGIEPVVILPDDYAERQRTLNKYSGAVKGIDLKFKFAVYENGVFIVLDSNGIPLSRMDIVPDKQPVIIQLCSKIDDKNSKRIQIINERFKEVTDTVAEPVFLRIPTAGTEITGAEFNNLDIYFNPVPSGFTPINSVQTGFMIDGDLLEIVKEIKTQSSEILRNQVISAISDTSGGRLYSALESLDRFSADKISSLNWTFRYLTDKSSAELSSFMKALRLKKEPQVVFTFYSDKSDMDIKHKKFLKDNFRFIDLQQEGNDRLETDSDILVINVPPLTSDVFKRLMAVSDSAVVSGENSLMEGLIFNKLGVGPVLLFKPAMLEHLSILSNPIVSSGRTALMDKIDNYARVSDDSQTDYFASFDDYTRLNETEQFIYNVIFDPQTNTLIRSVFTSIVPPVNGLNVLTDIIDKIDKKAPVGSIVKSHNLAVEANAGNIINEFFIDYELDFASPDDQAKFIETKLKQYIKDLLIELARMNLQPHDMKLAISNFADNVYRNYRIKLEELDNPNITALSENMQGLLSGLLSGIHVAENSSFFMPITADLNGLYEHTYIDKQAFSPVHNEAGTPRVVFFNVTNTKRLELLERIRNIHLAKELISNLSVGDLFNYHYYDELLPTYRQTPLQEEVLTGHLSEILLDSYLDLIEQYSDVLAKYNKTPDMLSLVNFLIHYREKSSRENFEFSRLSERENDLISEIVKLAVAVHTQPHQAGVTHFYRMFDFLVDDYESYLDDLISQKIQNGDFSITVRSVGASTGKEAYSVAAILEQSLFNYAFNNIYAHIEDISERTKLADGWIDLWDVKVYAFEVSCARLSVGLAGLYKLTDQDKESLDLERRKMFDIIYDDVFPVAVKVKDRLKRWFNPVYCDLDEDLSMLLRKKGEITFAMNFLTYVRSQKNVIAALRESTSPEYKSFFSYNESFDEEPVDHDLIEGQPLVVPPLVMPSMGDLIFAILAYKFESRAELADYLGIPLDYIGSVLDSEFKPENAVQDEVMYVNHANELVSSFFTAVSKDLMALSQTEVFKEFIDTAYREFVNDYVMSLSKLKVAPQEISRQLNFVTEKILTVYNENLKRLGLELLTDESRDILNNFLINTHILPYGNLFMPQSLKGEPLFEYIHLNLRAIVPKNDNEKADEIITGLVSPDTQKRFTADLNDAQYIFGLFKDTDVDISEIFSYEADEDEFKFNTHSEPAGSEIALFRVAVASLGLFRQILNEYYSEFQSLYGRADMKVLCDHIKGLLSKDSFRLESNVDQAVLRKYWDIESSLKKQYFNDGMSVFFREHEHWGDKLQQFIYDVISQKVDNGDLTFSIRSMGASDGREAYSLAAVLEQSLLKYANENLFKGQENAEQLARDWISSWDIKIYAFDENFKRLTVASEGLFNIWSKEREFFNSNPDLAGMVHGSYASSSDMTRIIRINPNLRNWIVPVYCNFDSDLTPVKNYPGEVTFAMNVIGYLEYPEAFEQVIKESGNPAYKSFLAFNRILSAPPNVFGEPFESSPATRPSVFSLGNAVITNGLDTRKKLARYFGVTEELIGEILNTPADEVTLISVKTFYANAAKSIVTDLVSGHYSVDNIESDQLIFTNTVLRDYIRDFIMSLAVVGMEKSNINNQLQILTDQVAGQYEFLLKSNGFQNVNNLTQNLSGKIQSLLSSITIAGSSHVFIPKTIDGTRYFEHTFVDANTFNPIEGNRNIPEIKNELVSEKTKDMLARDIEDTGLLEPIVDLFDYQFDFTNYIGEFLPAYDESETQIRKLKANVAHSMLDYIRYLNDVYKPELLELYGDGSFPQFVKLIEDILSVGENERFNDFRDELRNRINEFNTAVKYPEKVSGTDRDIRIFGRTYFFRDSKNWLADLENYLDGLILQKVSNGDLSLSIRSIGSATGRESYGIGIVFEQRLLAYASEYLFKDITDESLKEKLAQQWIDKWDVKLYILDISFHRLAAAKEGIYRLFTVETEFFESHPEYKEMFADIVDTGAPARHPFVAKVRDRLKRWAVPVYINLNNDLSPLQRTPSEISFVKNVLRFVNNPATVINAVLDSTNPAYKSFFGYNHVNEKPIVLSEIQERFSLIEQNDHVLPPANMFTPQAVYNLALMLDNYETKPLSDILGISEKELSEIYNEDIFLQAVSFVDTYLNETGNSVDLSVFDKKLRKYVMNLSMWMARNDISIEQFSIELSNFAEQAEFILKNRLSALNIEDPEQQSDKYKKRIDDYLSKIIIAPKGHMFIPVSLAGKQMYEHSYIDWQAFLTNYDVSKIISEPVTEQVKNSIISDLEDLQYARRLIENVNVERLYIDFSQRQNMPFYEGNERQFDILTDRIALIALGQFRLMVDKYRDILIDAKGKADMEAFAEYILDYTTRTEHFKETREVMPVIDDYISLVTSIVPSKQIAPGVTHFFRKYNDWMNHYEEYLKDVIPQKAASGDFTFTLRSVGSSNGKEAYSMLAVLEQGLKKYARENLFRHASEKEREILVEQWLDLWDIKCYAYDADFTRLATMYEGIYSGVTSLKLFFDNNPGYEDMLDVFFPSLDNFVRMNQRLRRWINPVYCDLEGDLTAVSSRKAEITFAFNTLPYLDSHADSIESLRQTLFNTASDGYKSFVGYNLSFESAPVSHGLLSGQPMVVPPILEPSIGHIVTAVMKMGLNSIAGLSAYFGINEDRLSEVLIGKHNLTENDYVYINLLANDLLRDFAESSLDWQSDYEQPAFLQNNFKQYIKNLFQKFTGLNIQPYVTAQFIDKLSESLSANYELMLKENNELGADQLSESFKAKLSDFMKKTKVLEGGHLILPHNINSVDCYEHIYFRKRAFYRGSSSPVIMSEPLPVSALDGFVSRLEDYQGIRQIIDYFDLDSFLRHYFSDEVIPGYEETEQQVETIKNHMAVVLYDYFNKILNNHTAFLHDKYGQASIKILAYQIGKLLQDGAQLLSADEQEIISQFNKLKDVMKDDYGKSGLTGFFRNEEDWYKQYRQYLKDVIAQKADVGDLTFNLRSIGSSTGKEAYSIAAILEQELENYAYENVFQNISNDKQRRESAKQWVDLWNVKVYAVDTSIQRLTASLEGIYHADGGWLEFIGAHPEYREKFYSFDVSDDPLSDTLAVDDRLRRWIFPVYANLDEGLGALDRYNAEVTFALNVIPYLDYSENFMRKLTDNSSAPYKMFVAYNENFASPPNNHYLLGHQFFTIPLASNPPVGDIARSIYKNNLQFTDQTAAFWGIEKERFISILNDQDGLDENAFKPMASALVDELFDKTPAQGTRLNDHSYFISAVLRDFLKSYVMNLSQNSFREDTIIRILNILKENMVSDYSIRLALSDNVDADVLSSGFGKRLEDFLSVIDILPNGTLIMPVLLDGKVYFEVVSFDRHAFLYDRQIDGAFEVVSTIVSSQERDRIVSEQAKIQQVAKILKISGFENIFIESYEDFYTNYNKDVVLEHMKHASLDYFTQMVVKYQPLLKRLYGRTDLVGLAGYIEDLYNNSGHIAHPEDQSILNDLEVFKRNTENKFAMPENEIFFNLFENWSDDFADYLTDLIAMKTALSDFTLSVRSLGALTGKEAYTAALLIERTMLSYAEKYVYPDIDSAEHRAFWAQKWLEKWDIKIFAMDKDLHNLSIAKEGVYNISKDSDGIVSENQSNMRMFETVRLVGKDYVKNGRVKLLFRNWIVPVLADTERDLSVLERYSAEITFAFNFNVHNNGDMEEKIKNTGNPLFKSYLLFNSETGKPANIGLIKGQPHVLPPSIKPDEKTIRQVIDSPYGESAITSFEETAVFFGISPADLNNILESGTYKPDKKIDNLQKTFSLIESMM